MTAPAEDCAPSETTKGTCAASGAPFPNSAVPLMVMVRAPVVRASNQEDLGAEPARVMAMRYSPRVSSVGLAFIWRLRSRSWCPPAAVGRWVVASRGYTQGVARESHGHDRLCLLPPHPIPTDRATLRPAFLLHDLDALHSAHLERLPVPAHDGQAVRCAEGLRVIGGEDPFLGAYLGVLAPAGLVVEGIEGRRLGQEAVGVALGEEAAVHAGEVLLRRGGAEPLEELGLAATEHPHDGVVQRLAHGERIPVGGEQHLEGSLVALGHGRQHPLEPFLAEALLHERQA